MATTTFNAVDFNGSEKPGLNLKKFFNNAFNRFVEARSKEAQVRVDSYLRSLSDDNLLDLNFSSDEIKKLKAGYSLSEIR